MNLALYRSAHNSILVETQFGIRRNTQEAEEAPLLRV